MIIYVSSRHLVFNKFFRIVRKSSVFSVFQSDAVVTINLIKLGVNTKTIVFADITRLLGESVMWKSRFNVDWSIFDCLAYNEFTSRFFSSFLFTKENQFCLIDYLRSKVRKKTGACLLEDHIHTFEFILEYLNRINQ